MFCNHCRAENVDGSQFCNRCGQVIAAVPPQFPQAAPPQQAYAAPVAAQPPQELPETQRIVPEDEEYPEEEEEYEPRRRYVPAKRTKNLAVLLVIVVGSVGLVGMIVWSLIGGDSVRTAANDYAHAMKEEDWATLVRLSTGEWRDNIKRMRKMAAKSKPGPEIDGYVIGDYDLDGDSATVDVTFETDGDSHNMVMEFRKVKDRWKVAGMRLATEDAPSRTGSRSDANEEQAAHVLKTFIGVQASFRQSDYDRNGIKDYWVEDVAGLYGVTNASGEKLKLISVAIAKADSRHKADYDPPLVDAENAVPMYGYYYTAVVSNERGKKYADIRTSEFAFCAWPMKYGTTGTKTFIINQAGNIYSRDRKGKRIKKWPASDPTTKGWALEGY